MRDAVIAMHPTAGSTRSDHPHAEIEEGLVVNIEDLIRAANPVTASDVAAGDSPHARRTLARILVSAPTRRRGPRPARAGGEP